MSNFASSIKLITLNIFLEIIFDACPAIVLGVWTFVYAGKNWDTSCDSDWISLPVWLVVSGVVSIVFAVTSIVFVVVQLGICAISWYAGLVKKTYVIPFVVLHSGLSLLYLIFLIVWAIIGRVALFKDGSNCQDDISSLWAMSLAVFIIEIFSLFAILCTSGCFILLNVKTATAST